MVKIVVMRSKTLDNSGYWWIAVGYTIKLGTMEAEKTEHQEKNPRYTDCLPSRQLHVQS